MSESYTTHRWHEVILCTLPNGTNPARPVQVPVYVARVYAIGQVMADVDVYRRGDMVKLERIDGEGCQYWEIVEMVK